MYLNGLKSRYLCSLGKTWQKEEFPIGQRALFLTQPQAPLPFTHVDQLLLSEITCSLQDELFREAGSAWPRLYEYVDLVTR